MEFVDYYEVLGVHPEANASEIKCAYRKLARKFHPDVSQESDSEARFKAIGEAYSVLKETKKRRRFDDLRSCANPAGYDDFKVPPEWQQNPGSAHRSSGEARDFGDFFREIFGTGQQPSGARTKDSATGTRTSGADVYTNLEISLADAFKGTTVPMTLSASRQRACGQLDAQDKSFKVTIPAGVLDGQRIRLRAQGNPGIDGAAAGDLYIDVQVLEDEHFKLHGRNVTSVLSIAPWEAALGAVIDVPTLAGTVKLTIPPGSGNGKKLKLKGRGFSGQVPGDHVVVLQVDVPAVENDEQRALYESMRRLWSEPATVLPV